MKIINENRRVGTPDLFEDIGKKLLHGQIIDCLKRNEPIGFVLPGFPCKSSNTTTKVLGKLPDKGEELALRKLHELCESIRKIHKPGAQVLIVSDGRIFADLVNVCDNDITKYHEELKRMNTSHNISLINLEDLITQSSFKELRKVLLDKFGMSLDDVRNEIKSSKDTKNLYLGLTRFMMDDLKVEDGESNNSFRKRCKKIALQMVQRSRSYDNLINSRFPNLIRLSIHPHSTANNKFGINLISNDDSWGTPWHNVAVRCKDGSFKLVKKKFAKSCKLIFENGRPSYFQE